MDYGGITFDHEIPAIFSFGETFRFQGKIERDMSKDPFHAAQASFVEVGNPDNKFTCTQHLDKGQTEFDFSCKMLRRGRFYFTMSVGTSLKLKRELKFINEPKEPFVLSEVPVTPSMLKLSVLNNQLYVEWESVSALTKLRFVQNNKVKEFMLSNYHQMFKVPFYEFEDFEMGDVEVHLMHASSRREGFDDRNSEFSPPLSFSFKALEHKTAMIKSEAANLNPVPWRVKEK